MGPAKGPGVEPRAQGPRAKGPGAGAEGPKGRGAGAEGPKGPGQGLTGQGVRPMAKEPGQGPRGH